MYVNGRVAPNCLIRPRRLSNNASARVGLRFFIEFLFRRANEEVASGADSPHNGHRCIVGATRNRIQ